MIEKAIILVAGMAIRMGKLTKYKPKCMLELGNELILERMLRILIAEGIKEFVFVLGFKKDMIKYFVENSFSGYKFTYLENNDYMNNNNSYSLYVALKNTEAKPFLLLDGDIVFNEKCIDILLENGNSDALLVRREGDMGIEEMKVLIDENYCVKSISKEIDPQKAYGESIGIEKFSRNSHFKMLDELTDLIENKKEVNNFYEVAFQNLINSNKINLFAFDISPYKALEIDTEEDYSNAIKFMKEWKND
ncbi:MAG: NTP transferase domain-containing protein [Candidatus Coatesbacteria bacterium]|nr:NTP transferase domain-containing protein [Candidatus Coatesbacteria bacterium]